MPQRILEPYLWNIEEMFRNIYTVPVYQRPYSWEKAQIEVLIDDILAAYSSQSGENKEGYFIGSIYIHDKNESLNGSYHKYDIIDGQQRMTTITLLLLSIYSHAISYGTSEGDTTLITVKKSLWKQVDRKFNKNNRTLTLQSIENKAFEALYNSCFDKPNKIMSFCDTYANINPFEKRLVANFKYIYKRIRTDFPKDKVEELLNFTEFVLYHVQIISIDSSCTIRKAFSIFESINSKGKPLV